MTETQRQTRYRQIKRMPSARCERTDSANKESAGEATLSNEFELLELEI
ncbi:MAG: hypothetical protein IH831_02105 [Planctomycetes bacterium]|nr:hypothetical protein [Planctomycetota bacterium]